MENVIQLLAVSAIGICLGVFLCRAISKTRVNLLEKSYQDLIGKVSNIEAELKSTSESKVRAETKLEEKEAICSSLKIEFEELSQQNQDLRSQVVESISKLESTRNLLEEQKKFIEDSSGTLREAFAALSSSALKDNNDTFLQLAKTELEKQTIDSKQELEKRQQAIEAMVTPLREGLSTMTTQIQDFEIKRVGAYSEVITLINSVQGSTQELQKGTQSLVSALKTSHTRGKYGEIGLRRVVEFSGLNDYCDFEEQVSVSTEDGILRPDMIVKLPQQKTVIVDSKVPLMSYLASFETTDEIERTALLVKHAAAVREHLKKLSSKQYWNQFEESPDFVVMYLQIESTLGAALEHDRDLIEYGMNNNIIIATPTTLLTVLRSIAFSWQQVKFAENVLHLKDASIELYNRVTTLLQHISAVGGSLSSAVGNYNKMVGSLEGRFIPQVRKMKEIGGSVMDKVVPGLEPIDTVIRPLAEISSNDNIDQHQFETSNSRK